MKISKKLSKEGIYMAYTLFDLLANIIAEMEANGIRRVDGDLKRKDYNDLPKIDRNAEA